LAAAVSMQMNTQARGCEDRDAALVGKVVKQTGLLQARLELGQIIGRESG
jgi:hypothetical protein